MKAPARVLLVSSIATIVCGTVLAAPPMSVPVRIHVSGKAGDTIPDAYTALVPAWRPWASPLAEGITENGVITFRVPKGTYHIVCGAKGFQVATDGPYSFIDDSGGNFNILLDPLLTVSGKVTDERGAPLAGVRVAESRAAIPPPFGNVRRLAFDQLSSGWSTVTDDGGNWVLGVPDGKVPLVFTAAGRVVQWRLCKAGDPQPLAVSLPAGAATLAVTLDRVDPNLTITLEREGPDPVESVPRTWQRQVWAQRASAQSLAWKSLPAGVYSVYAKYTDPAFFMRRAKKIGKAALSAGETATLDLALPDPQRAASSIVRLFLENTSPRELDVDDLEAYAFDPASGLQRVPSLVEPSTGGAVLHVALEPPLRSPVYLVTADRFIAALADTPQPIPPDEPPFAARVYPRADARLSLRPAEKDLPFPRYGMAVLRNCMKTPRVMVPVDIRGGNLAHFTAPAGCQSSTIAFNPFEPVLLTKSLRPGEQSLGEFLLHAAASADVRVVRDPGGAAVSGAIVRLSASADDSPARQRVLAAEAETGPEGWAHIDSVPVLRELQIVAQAPGGDLSVAADAHAEPRGRVVIDPLSIPKPAALQVAVTVQSSVRALFPSARVRSVSVEPVDSRRADAERRQAAPHGDDVLRFEPLKPGKWRIAAIVEAGGSYAHLKVDEIELHPGEARAVNADLAPLIFQGVVTQGGQGVAARVTLSNRSVPDLVRQHFDSKKDGSFYALLPDKGIYETSAVLLDAQSDDMPAGEVEFNDPSRPVQIVLPSTATVVAHVRSDGQPLPNVDVVASLTAGGSGTVEQQWRGRATDARGDVRFEHLVSGEWVFSANDSNGGTAAKAVMLRGSESTEVVLNVERNSSVRGVVRYPSGVPAPHVRVDCLYVPPTGLPARSTAETDIDGRFVIDTYSQSPISLQCSAVAPVGIVSAFKATNDGPVDVQLPAATATLRIADWARFYNPEAFWLVAADGAAVRIASIADVVGHSGELLQIPALAAGRWRVIRVQSIPQWLTLAAVQSAALPAITSVELEPGATQTLHVYGLPAADRGN